jgi:hypothetical protein
MLTEAWEGERLPKGSDCSNREAGVAKRERTARGGGEQRQRGGDAGTERGDVATKRQTKGCGLESTRGYG